MFCFVTNRKLIPYGDLYTLINHIKVANIDKIILREKDLSSEELLKMSLGIKEILKGYQSQLMVNGDVDVARKVNAHGVHFPFEIFRETNKRHGVTGVSVHSLEEALFAENNGADYILAGHIFKTCCKENLQPRGLDYLKAISTSVSIPVIGIGGIKPCNIPDIVSRGAKGIAVMSSINEAVNPVQRIADYEAGLKIFNRK